MLLAHAIALAEARSYLAALADHAAAISKSSAYERTLDYLDSVCGEVPAVTADGLVQSVDLLHTLAHSAIDDLASHGVDALQVELLLAMLEDAHLESTGGNES